MFATFSMRYHDCSSLHNVGLVGVLRLGLMPIKHRESESSFSILLKNILLYTIEVNLILRTFYQIRRLNFFYSGDLSSSTGMSTCDFTRTRNPNEDLPIKDVHMQMKYLQGKRNIDILGAKDLIGL